MALKFDKPVSPPIPKSVPTTPKPPTVPSLSAPPAGSILAAVLASASAFNPSQAGTSEKAVTAPRKPVVPEPRAPKPADSSPAERVKVTYKQLSQAASGLNSASDELTKAIRAVEARLKGLNLGIPAWVRMAGGETGPQWWDRGIGYVRLKDRWGIALRTREGNDNFPDDDSEELWAFDEAPRWLRIDGVGKLPDLLDALLKQAEETTLKIRAKIDQANELALALSVGLSESEDRGDR